MRELKKKLQIFVSSTYVDMKEERQKIVEAILAAGHIPAGMELFASEDAAQWKVIQRWIEESDVYLILLGGRYGSINSNTNLSYTHMEFNFAQKKNKPTMSIILSDEFIQEKISKGIYNANLPVETSNKNYLELKDTIRTKMSSECSSLGEISAAVARMFSNNPAQFNRCSGWVSGKDFKKSESSLLQNYGGVTTVSTGIKRHEEFRLIRERAKNEIYIIGAGMSQLSRVALPSLQEQLKHASIHLYMLDPIYLEEHMEYANSLESFFGIQHFSKHVRLAYDTLKEFCEKQNSDSKKKHTISLSVYRTLPAMSMVLIDPNSKNGEAVVEFFTYHCGEERPLLKIKRGTKSPMFDSMYAHAKMLFQASNEVVK